MKSTVVILELIVSQPLTHQSSITLICMRKSLGAVRVAAYKPAAFRFFNFIH